MQIIVGFGGAVAVGLLGYVAGYLAGYRACRAKLWGLMNSACVVVAEAEQDRRITPDEHEQIRDALVSLEEQAGD